MRSLQIRELFFIVAKLTFIWIFQIISLLKMSLPVPENGRVVQDTWEIMGRVVGTTRASGHKTRSDQKYAESTQLRLGLLKDFS